MGLGLTSPIGILGLGRQYKLVKRRPMVKQMASRFLAITYTLFSLPKELFGLPKLHNMRVRMYPTTFEYPIVYPNLSQFQIG